MDSEELEAKRIKEWAENQIMMQKGKAWGQSELALKVLCMCVQ